MLVHLALRDYVLVERVDLELAPGMTVLTGETGAGKSILVDALGLVAGDRASGTVVREGRDRAEVTALFELAPESGAARWLAERELASPDEAEACTVRRVVGADGRSRAFVNERPVTIQVLRELGEHLVDIHGQHAHQSLLRRDVQRAILDAFAGKPEVVAAVAAAAQRWQAANAALEAVPGAGPERDARLDLLRFQVAELDDLGLADGEVERLEDEQRVLGHASDLIETCAGALTALDGDDEANAVAFLHGAVRLLGPARTLDPRLGEVCELLDAAEIQLGEAVARLRRHADALDLDPERLAEVEARLDAVHRLARKHRVGPEEVPGLARQLRAEIEALEGSEQHIARLRAELDAAARAWDVAAGELSRVRAAAAPELGRAIGAHLGELGMGGARIEVRLEPMRGDSPSPNGADRVELWFTGNPGQPARPLTEVASGGELARVGLCIALVETGAAEIETLVFDEVDAGLGGATADLIGQRLRRLAERRQVLCVTHLPQVAARAHGHVRVLKQTDVAHASATAESLDGQERVQEIARMLGGVEITERTLAHAREMLGRTRRGRRS